MGLCPRYKTGVSQWVDVGLCCVGGGCECLRMTPITREQAESVARGLSAIPSLPSPAGVLVWHDRVSMTVPLVEDVVAWAGYFGVGFRVTGLGYIVTRFTFEGVNVSVSTTVRAVSGCVVCGSTAASNRLRMRPNESGVATLPVCRAHEDVCLTHLLDPCPDCDGEGEK